MILPQSNLGFLYYHFHHFDEKRLSLIVNLLLLSLPVKEKSLIAAQNTQDRTEPAAGVVVTTVVVEAEHAGTASTAIVVPA